MIGENKKMGLQSDSVIIVDSPFQLLCGIEFIQHEKLNEKGDVHLIAVSNKSEENLRQIKNLYLHYSQEFNTYSEIEIKKKPGVLNFFHYLHIYSSVIRTVKNLRVETVILGDYANGYFRHIANKVRNKRIVVLDDGFGTLQTFNRDSWGAFDKEENLKALLSLGYYNSNKKDVELFTVFEGIVNYKNTINNSFYYLKGSMSEVKNTQDSYLIGTPVVEDGIVEKMVYLSYLGKIAENFVEGRMFYVPHRREEKEKIDEISNRYNFEIKDLEMPVELYFCINEVSPKNIVSFFSTSLFNLSKLFGITTKITSVKFKSSHIKKRNEHIDNIYQLLSKEVLIEEFN